MKVIATAKARACINCGERIRENEIVWEYPLPAGWHARDTERSHLACHRVYNWSE